MILPLEKQVPTRETCRRLQDAGFEAETLYIWQGPPTHKTWDLHQNGLLRAPSYYDGVLPAPTAAELGALLPAHIVHEERRYTRVIYPRGIYYRYELDDLAGLKDYDNLAEMSALLWLDLDAKDLLPAAAYGA